MIKHIVFVKIKGASEEEKKANLKKLKENLDKLAPNIPEVKNYQSGFNISDSERASDFVIIGDFESKEALKKYSNYPEHQDILEFISSIKGRTSIIDFEY